MRAERTKDWKRVAAWAAIAALYLVPLFTVRGAFDVFLKIEGVPGESADDKHKDWIEVLTWVHGLSVPTGGVYHGGGRTSERTTHYALTVTKRLDRASPTLSLACCRGDHLKQAELEFCRPDGDQRTVFDVVLSDVMVTSVQPYGEANGTNETPFEQVGFQYGKIRWTYAEADPRTGAARGDVEAFWDLVANKGSSAFTSDWLLPPVPDAPLVVITSAPPLLDQESAALGVTISGTHSNIVGDLWWRNAANETTRYFTPGAGSHWSAPLKDLAPGLNPITVWGRNAAGTGASDRADITVDDRLYYRAVVEITNESPMYVPYAIHHVIISGTNNAHAVTMTLWYSNAVTGAVGPFSPNSDVAAGTWSVTVSNLVPGLNPVSISGEDPRGNPVFDALSIIRELPAAAPAIAILAAPPGPLAPEEDRATIGGTNNAAVAGTMWWVNATAGVTGFCVRAATDWTAALTNLLPGLNLIYVYGTNQYEALAYETLTIERAWSPGAPALTITSDVPARVAWDVTDVILGGTNNEAVAGAMWWVNTANHITSRFSRAGTVWTATVTELAPGVNDLYVSATNLWGELAYQVVSVARDRSPGAPAIAITNDVPTNLSYDVTSLTLSGTNNEHVAGRIWWLNTTNHSTGTFGPVAAAWTTTPIAVDPGLNVIYVYATNLWHELAYDVVSVTRAWGAGPPLVAITNAPAPI